MPGSTVIDSRDGIRGVLSDAESGRVIRWVRWADLETGEYQAFRIDPKEARQRGIPLHQVLYRGRARLRWVPSPSPPHHPRSAPAPTEPTPAPVAPVRRKAERCLVLVTRPCQHYGCLRAADWKVSDEEELPPATGLDGRQYEQAQTVAVRWYCSRHYAPPRVLAPNGDVIRVLDEVKARPG